MEQISPKAKADIDEWETEMQLKVAKVGKIHLFSNCLCDADKQLTGVVHIDSLVEAIQQSVDQFGDKRLAVIPEGPYVIPRFSAAD
jgi:hypothetical protein